MQSNRMTIVRPLALTLAFLFPVLIALGAEARIFNTELGRWTRRDPLGYVDGMNEYAYGVGRAVTVVDPLGRRACVQDRDRDPGLGCILNPNDECAEEIIDNCMSNPYVREALRYASESCGSGELCNTWTVKCYPMRAGRLPTPKVCCRDCTIRIHEQIDCATLAHELIHAGDLCKWGDCGRAPGDSINCGTFGDGEGGVDCDAFICSELRAHHYGCCIRARNGGEPYDECMDWVERFLRTAYPDCNDVVDFDPLWNRCVPTGGCPIDPDVGPPVQIDPIPPFTPVVVRSVRSGAIP